MIEPYYIDSDCTLYCGRAEEILPQLKERVDLVLTDPPYGIDAYGKGMMGGGVLAKQSRFEPTEWDRERLTRMHIEMLRHYSEHQIVWGGNYYADWFPASACWLVWHKDNGANDFADCELAWTSLPGAVRYFKWRWQGMLQQNMKRKEERWHPTQKPLALMKWCIDLARLESGALILDPFCGVATTLVAAKLRGCRSIGIEASEKYCELAVKERLNRPLPLFDDERANSEQQQIFS